MSSAAVRWIQTEEQHNRVRQPDQMADKQSTRFIWQPREDIPHAEVLGGLIERCRVMPVVRWLKWDRIEDVPLEFREPGMTRKDGEGKIAYAAYATLPGYITEGIMDQYRAWGVVELTALRGIDAGRFAALRIDTLFFPETKSVDEVIDETPQTYAAMRARIHQVLNLLREGQIEQLLLSRQIKPEEYPIEQVGVLLKSGQQMLDAIRIAERFDTALVDESEGELELGKNNPRYKQKYDPADHAALRRLNRPRRDAFIKNLAEDQVDLKSTLRDIVEKNSQTGNIKEIAETIATSVGAAVAKEFAGLMATQRGIPVQEPTPAPAAAEPAKAETETPKAQAETEAPKPSGNKSNQPKFQNNNNR